MKIFAEEQQTATRGSNSKGPKDKLQSVEEKDLQYEQTYKSGTGNVFTIFDEGSERLPSTLKSGSLVVTKEALKSRGEKGTVFLFNESKKVPFVAGKDGKVHLVCAKDALDDEIRTAVFSNFDLSTLPERKNCYVANINGMLVVFAVEKGADGTQEATLLETACSRSAPLDELNNVHFPLDITYPRNKEFNFLSCCHNAETTRQAFLDVFGAKAGSSTAWSLSKPIFDFTLKVGSKGASASISSASTPDGIKTKQLSLETLLQNSVKLDKKFFESQKEQASTEIRQMFKIDSGMMPYVKSGAVGLIVSFGLSIIAFALINITFSPILAISFLGVGSVASVISFFLFFKTKA